MNESSYFILPNFCSRSFDDPLAAIIPTHNRPSRTFPSLLNLLNYIVRSYARSTAFPITGLREGELNSPECPLTCARSISTIAFSSSISSFSSTFSPCNFVFSSLHLENSVAADVLGVFGGGLLGISLSFASIVWICRRDPLMCTRTASQYCVMHRHIYSYRACSSILLWVLSYASSCSSIFLYLLSITLITSVCSWYFCTSASLASPLIGPEKGVAFRYLTIIFASLCAAQCAVRSYSIGQPCVLSP